jgi:2-polyprenyl-3-methyl-5-hydroxy-6-metoxy-1,4-benzoquinol methylase
MDECPLCQSEDVAFYYQGKGIDYLRCLCCDLVFVPTPFHLSAVDEKLRYDTHENNSEDVGYRAFLSQALNPVIARIDKNAKGLDFGCGPGPTLSLMFAEQGYQMDLFDKFYANNAAVFDKQYDFITATEVLEHLSAPSVELNRLFASLKKGGILAVMTQMLTQKVDFATWYYKNDPTHICFFSQKTMRYVAKTQEVKVTFFADNVVLFMS